MVLAHPPRRVRHRPLRLAALPPSRRARARAARSATTSATAGCGTGVYAAVARCRGRLYARALMAVNGIAFAVESVHPGRQAPERADARRHLAAHRQLLSGWRPAGAARLARRSAAGEAAVELSVVIPTRDRPQRLLETMRRCFASSADGPGWEAIAWWTNGGSPEEHRSGGPLGRRRRARRCASCGRIPAARRARNPRRARGWRARAGVPGRRHGGGVALPGAPPEVRRREPGRLDRRPHHASRGAARDAVRPLPPRALGRVPTARTPRRAVQETNGISAANLALPAADFGRLGGFDEGFALAGCEDRELGLRARARRACACSTIRRTWLSIGTGRWKPCRATASASAQHAISPRCASSASTACAAPARGWSPRTRPSRANDGAPAWSRARRPRRSLATPPGRVLVSGLASLLERVAPDRPRRAAPYDAAVAVAIFRGVRQGLARYPEPRGA